MTEKRFKLEDIGFVYDNGTLIGMKEIVELLNVQHEEIEKLKKEREQLIQSIQDGAKMAADGIVKSMDKNFTLDTKYYRKRY